MRKRGELTIAEGRAIFVALPLPVAAREAVEGLVDRVRAAVPTVGHDGAEQRAVRWVRTDGLHVTVRFLGATVEDRIAGVERAVTDTAAATAPFLMRLHGGGGFPRPDAPRTLWLRITDGHEQLADLAHVTRDEHDPEQRTRRIEHRGSGHRDRDPFPGLGDQPGVRSS